MQATEEFLSMTENDFEIDNVFTSEFLGHCDLTNAYYMFNLLHCLKDSVETVEEELAAKRPRVADGSRPVGVKYQWGYLTKNEDDLWLTKDDNKEGPSLQRVLAGLFKDDFLQSTVLWCENQRRMPILNFKICGSEPELREVRSVMSLGRAQAAHLRQRLDLKEIPGLPSPPDMATYHHSAQNVTNIHTRNLDRERMGILAIAWYVIPSYRYPD
jgi:hypothetical protein